VKIRTEKKSLEMRAILGKNLKEPPLYKIKNRGISSKRLNFELVELYILQKLYISAMIKNLMILLKYTFYMDSKFAKEKMGLFKQTLRFLIVLRTQVLHFF
jgi:hypothetical protein